jgi:hypothetical protein
MLQTRVLPSFTEEPWYDEPASEVRRLLLVAMSHALAPVGVATTGLLLLTHS